MKLVLLDWNNTLLDDALAWHKSIAEIFALHQLSAPTLDQFYITYRGDHLATFAHFGLDISQATLEKLYIPRYIACAEQTSLMPGVHQLLNFLDKQPVILGIITAQLRTLVEPLLERYGLNGQFKYICYEVQNKRALIKELV